MEELGVKSEENAIVDDQAMKLKAGMELGCKTYWIKREWKEFYPNKKSGEPTKRIYSVKELKEVLND